MQTPKTGKYALSAPGSKRDSLMSMLGSLDENVGKILAALENNGLTNKTLVVFMSDNGGATDTDADNSPLEGNKHSGWEGGTRVPMIASWPGTLKPGATFNEMVMGFDLFPTFVGLTRASMPSSSLSFDGVDFWPWLEKVNEAPTKTGALHDILIWDQNERENFDWSTSIESFTWENTNSRIDIGIRMGDWKLRVEGGDISLYNLADDIGETRNVLDANTAVFDEMKTAYNAWHAEMPPQPEAVEGAEISACLDPRFEEYEPDLTKVTRHSDTKCDNLIPKDGCRDHTADNFDYTVTNHIQSTCEYTVAVEKESPKTKIRSYVKMMPGGISIQEDVQHSIHVVDIQGKEIYLRNGIYKGFYSLDFLTTSGLYLVRIKLGESVVTMHRIVL
jgi:hypothetical protein